jgi:phosphatidylinositol-3-phosphatase
VRNRLLLTAAIAAAAIGLSTAVAVSSQAAAAQGPCGTAAAPGAYKHVIWIWMENRGYRDIIGNKAQAPYINALAAGCGLATDYHVTTHPSLPDYLAATSGLAQSDLPVLSYLDCGPSAVCGTSAASIFSQGETWKAYAESMPSNCDKSDSGQYSARHNPAVYYKRLSGCATRDVPFRQLAADLAAGALPAFSFVTPNLTDDMHDGTIAQGDGWLAHHLPAVLASKEYRAGTTAVFVTWDEGSGGYPVEDCDNTTSTDASCRVPTIVISPSTRAGTRSGAFFTHYSLLATAEQLLGLPKLRSAKSAATMTAAFRL